MFMYLFRGEMSNRTLHYWFLAPARRDVLLAGKYPAGFVAAAVLWIAARAVRRMQISYGSDT
jgi:ABC-type transport system involved in multi-copper enzyme maturation permease subunit